MGSGMEHSESSASVGSAAKRQSVASHQPPATNHQSLTDPVDLLALLGRFSAAVFLFLVTIALLGLKRYDIAILTGGGSLLLQLATHRMWRRLRDERLAKIAERDATGVEQDAPPVPTVVSGVAPETVGKARKAR
jgi:hypothetical protein